MKDSNTIMRDQLDRFCSTEDVHLQAEALSELMKVKQLHQAAKDPLFEKGFQALLRSAEDTPHPGIRLKSMASLIRIGSLVKTLRPRVVKELSRINEPLPPLQDIVDPDDRFYVANIWRHVDHAWIPGFLAVAAIEEELAEKVRSECMEGLIAMTPDLATTLELLLTPLRRLDFRTEKPADSKGRRVRRIVEALRVAYELSMKDAGVVAGERLRALLIESFQQTGTPAAETVLDEVSEEALGLVHAIVRARFSSATLPETYAALTVVRNWYREQRWEEFTEASKSAQLLARDISEAIELLVRAGIADDSLYNHLITASGTATRARSRAKEILERTPGLSEDLARWLSGIVAKRRSAFAAENQMLSFDEAIADLMIDASRLEEMQYRVEREALPEISVMVPASGELIESLMRLVRSTNNALAALVKVRGLAIVGRAGDAVDFSPLEHEMAGGMKPGFRKVRIFKPGVDAPSESGGRRVVRKAIVEPLS